jgi:tol-pal system protein YbgF
MRCLGKLSCIAVGALVLSTASCVSTKEYQALFDQVQLLRKGSADLQRRQDEHALRLDGVDNSIQMMETRVDDNSERLEELRLELKNQASTAPIVVSRQEPADRQVESTDVEPPAPAAPSQPTPAPAVKPGRAVSAPEGKPEDVYSAAYGSFERQEYGQAISRFEEYIAAFPQTELADNAQYWIGECYYAQKDYKQALREFDKVEKNFPKGNKIPDAKFKKALSSRELGNRDDAARELREVISRYPDSQAAIMASEKLRIWK